MSDLPEEKKTRPKSLTPRQTAEKICNYLMPLLILLVYIAATSAIYYAVERDCEITYVCPATYLVLENSLEIDNILPNVDEEQIENSTGLSAEKIKAEVLPKSKQTIYNNNTAMKSWENLTYWAAFHFIAVSVTTIGYGDIYPCTEGGQILVIVFSIIGIPITLIAMTRTGKLLGYVFHKVWLKIYCKCKKPPYTDHQQRLFNNKHYVPFSLGLLITLAWILLASIYFYFTLAGYYKDFSYFNAFYFTVISFLTIGYGDISPVKYTMILPTFLFLLIGLSLVTMCIELMQIQIEMMFQEMVEMIDEEFVSQIDDDDKTMSNDKKTAVKDLLQTKKQNSNLATKVLMPFMGKSNQKKLANIYEAKSKLVSVEIQATVETNHEEIQVNIVGHLEEVWGDSNRVKLVPLEVIKRDFECQVEFQCRKQTESVFEVTKVTIPVENLEKSKQNNELFRKVSEK